MAVLRARPPRPAERSGSYAERISRKYGIPVGQARASMSRIIQVGADAGIDFRFDDARLGNTFDAHRLIHLARSHGRQEELKDRLFAAAFTEGRPIGDHETLVELAVEAGIPEADARRVLGATSTRTTCGPTRPTPSRWAWTVCRSSSSTGAS